MSILHAIRFERFLWLLISVIFSILLFSKDNIIQASSSKNIVKISSDIDVVKLNSSSKFEGATFVKNSKQANITIPSIDSKISNDRQIINNVDQIQQKRESHNVTQDDSDFDMSIVSVDNLHDKRESLRHEYNFSGSSPRATTIASNNENNLGHLNITNRTSTTIDRIESETINASNNSNSVSDLSPSDSRPMPSSSRFDENYGTTSEVGGDPDLQVDLANAHQLTPYFATSASNLMEQRAMTKELQKILSNGVSSALDPVKLETLEHWRERQRERKALKEKRSKLIEDILSTAIETNVDNVNNQSKHGVKNTNNKNQSQSSKQKPHVRRSRQKSGSKKPIASMAGAAASADLDSDMLGDTEVVLQHLQGLAQAIDNHSPNSDSSSFNGDSYDSDSPATSSSNNSHDSTDNNNADSGDEDTNNNDAGARGKSPINSADESSSNGPIMRHFKKIKQSISQRRKQLDQIKKMFNIELALNSKDGSLVGKPTSSKTNSNKQTNSNGNHKHGSKSVSTSSSTQSIEDPDESFSLVADADGNANLLNNNEFPSSQAIPEYNRRRRKSSSPQSNAKMRDLKQYLVENPDILASIMAELTVNADPTDKTPAMTKTSSSSSSSLPYRISSSSFGGLNVNNFDDSDTESRSDQTSPPQLRHLNNNYFNNNNDYRSSGQKINTNRFVNNNNINNDIIDEDDFRDHDRLDRSQAISANSRERARLSSRNSINIISPPQKSSIKNPSFAETLLIESLRDRQLKNLARLESMLQSPDRQQATSNRSHVHVAPSSGNQHSHGEDDSPASSTTYRSRRSDRSSMMANNVMIGSNKVRSLPSTSALQHHFLMVDNPESKSNPSNYETDSNHQIIQSNDAQRQNPQTNTLNRFKDWRDVSHSELPLSSSQNIAAQHKNLENSMASNATEDTNNLQEKRQMMQSFSNATKARSLPQSSNYLIPNLTQSSIALRPAVILPTPALISRPQPTVMGWPVMPTWFMPRSSAAQQGHHDMAQSAMISQTIDGPSNVPINKTIEHISGKQHIEQTKANKQTFTRKSMTTKPSLKSNIDNILKTDESKNKLKSDEISEKPSRRPTKPEITNNKKDSNNQQIANYFHLYQDEIAQHLIIDESKGRDKARDVNSVINISPNSQNNHQVADKATRLKQIESNTYPPRPYMSAGQYKNKHRHTHGDSKTTQQIKTSNSQEVTRIADDDVNENQVDRDITQNLGERIETDNDEDTEVGLSDLTFGPRESGAMWA